MIWPKRNLLLQWRDSPLRAVTSSVVRLQISLSHASLLHPVIFSKNEESLLMFSHLSRDLPTSLLPLNFPSSILFRWHCVITMFNVKQTASEGPGREAINRGIVPASSIIFLLTEAATCGV